ncbi:MAG: hypothetical protein ACQKBU_08290 [Verrucomicrobiales bacterium]
MLDRLRKSEDVRSFLRRGTSVAPKGKAVGLPSERIAVTVRLPKEIADALIDASAERRKNRQQAWSQQDIVAEAVSGWLYERANQRSKT